MEEALCQSEVTWSRLSGGPLNITAAPAAIAQNDCRGPGPPARSTPVEPSPGFTPRRGVMALAALALLFFPLAGCAAHQRSPVAGLYVQNFRTPHPSMLLLLADGTYFHYFYRPSARLYGFQRGRWHRGRSGSRYTFTNMCFYPSDHNGPPTDADGVGGYWCPHLHRNSAGRAEFRPIIDEPQRYFVWRVGVSGALAIERSLAAQPAKPRDTRAANDQPSPPRGG